MSCLKGSQRDYKDCKREWIEEATPYCRAQSLAIRVYGSDLAVSSYGKICVDKRLKDQACLDAIMAAKQDDVYKRCLREILEGGPFYDGYPGRSPNAESGDLVCDSFYLRPCRDALSKALGACRP